MKITRTKRIYCPDFKRQVCLRVVNEGTSVLSLSHELDIGESILHRWGKEYRQRERWAQLLPGDTEKPELDNVLEENRRLRMEVEMLKKASAYFARHINENGFYP